MKRAMKQAAGRVFLVGAGPGAPDLLTLRAAEVLKRADVVFHDALVHPEVLALAGHAEKIAVGKRCGRFATAQQFINKRLADAAWKHNVVVRLKGGDPMLFGRAQEEIAALEAAGVPYEVVPGVTSALAAAAEAGVSLTQRGVARSVTFVTPRVGQGEAPSAWAKSAVAADTAIFYMGAGQAQEITTALLAAGAAPDLPVLVAENATLPQARRIALTLEELPEIARYGLTGPTLIMVGRAFAAALAAAEQEALSKYARA
ncbi:MAG TPA: uroporphyrinogen-III C-methyltransferase [Burkholderiales bacterium]|nr:uroporphyrinogen-III C-methyltransferase [Burkholderiales bacterium]